MKYITNPEFKVIKEKLSLPIKEDDTGLFIFDSTLSYYSNLGPSAKKNLSKKIYFFYFLILLGRK